MGLAVPSITYAGRPVGIGSALVVRAVGRQFIGAILTAAAGWVLQATVLAHVSGGLRMVVSCGFCVAVYLFIVAGLLRLTEPIKVALRIAQDHMPAGVLRRFNVHL